MTQTKSGIIIPINDDIDAIPLSDDPGCPACGGKTHVSEVLFSRWDTGNCERGPLKKFVSLKILPRGRMKERRICEDCRGWTSRRLGSKVSRKGLELWKNRGKLLHPPEVERGA